MILLGEGEWEGLLNWLRERALADQRLDPADLDSLKLVGEAAEALEIVEASNRRQRARARDLHRRGT